MLILVLSFLKSAAYINRFEPPPHREYSKIEFFCCDFRFKLPITYAVITYTYNK